MSSLFADLQGLESNINLKLQPVLINSFLASEDFHRLLITYANSLNPDQDHSVGPNVDLFV